MLDDRVQPVADVPHQGLVRRLCNRRNKFRGRSIGELGDQRVHEEMVAHGGGAEHLHRPPRRLLRLQQQAGVAMGLRRFQLEELGKKYFNRILKFKLGSRRTVIFDNFFLWSFKFLIKKHFDFQIKKS